MNKYCIIILIILLSYAACQNAADGKKSVNEESIVNISVFVLLLFVQKNLKSQTVVPTNSIFSNDLEPINETFWFNVVSAIMIVCFLTAAAISIYKDFKNPRLVHLEEFKDPNL